MNPANFQVREMCLTCGLHIAARGLPICVRCGLHKDEIDLIRDAAYIASTPRPS